MFLAGARDLVLMKNLIGVPRERAASFMTGRHIYALRITIVCAYVPCILNTVWDGCKGLLQYT
jgi:hypothetical protein